MISQFIKDESGQDIVEYSFLLVLIALAAVVGLTAIGQSVGAIFSKIQLKIDEVGGSA